MIHQRIPLLLAVALHRIGFGLMMIVCFSIGLAAVLIATVVLLWTRIAFGELKSDYAYLRHGLIPLGVIAGNFVLAFLGIAGVRVLRRMLGEQIEARRRAAGRRRGRNGQDETEGRQQRQQCRRPEQALPRRHRAYRRRR